MSELNEKCAVFGVYGEHMDVSRLTFFGLFALQHRGQESSGMAVSDGVKISSHKGVGFVSHVFTEEVIDSLKGYSAVGHNRYSTCKDSSLDHAHPIIINNNSLALVHNGNLPSTKLLKEFLRSKNVLVTDDFSDSRLMTEAIGWHMVQGDTLPQAVQNSFPLFTGSFSLLVMDNNTMIAVRDSYGIRPLSLARLNGGFVFSSETCAFSPIGATFIREVLPGEMVIVDKAGLRSVQVTKSTSKLDIFEFIYFARHDSNLLGKSVYEVRKNFGKNLAKECQIKADVVIAVPETSLPMAMGYSRESGIPYEMGLTKNRYIQRTFIQPDQRLRQQGVKMKLTPLPEVLKDQRVIVIDDSIVRGTTSRQVVKMLFDAGAREVHFMVSSPPIRFPDFYGIDIPNQNDLLAFKKDIEEMRVFLGATSLHFLSLQGVIDATGIPQSEFNTSCFTGEYPIDLKERALEFMHASSIPQPLVEQKIVPM
ncbi:MAG: amidophosphoribosyltransferase [Candidatus Taylorbacteria bacterium]|nr:amidophosphoribosyltransferase [Candidatus Taylorbacteria bacterium]